MNLRSELEAGRLANLDAVAWAGQSTIVDGPARGTRAIDVRVWDGIGCRIYPDRGLDLGQAWFRGVPLAWVSRIGEAAPRRDLDGFAWGEAFGGGLMTTCGLRNVGMPSEGHGLHGTYSHLPATGVGIDRTVTDEGAVVVIRGTVLDAAPPVPLQVERTIRIHAGIGLIELEDVTSNLGDETTPAPLLYHCNFGYPLWAPPARLQISAVATEARDRDSEVALDVWHEPPEVEETSERVLEHTLESGAGWGRARIANPELGVEVTIRWDRAELPRLNQWLDPNPGMSVLGIEPANCSTRGRAFDRAADRIPMLEPGSTRTTRLSFEAARP